MYIDISSLKCIFCKSQFMLVIFTAVAVLCILTGTAFQTERESARPLPFLSDEFIRVQIWHPDNMKESDLIQIMRAQGEHFFLAKEYPVKNGYAVFFDDPSLFRLQITEGRNFTEDDFREERRVALVGEESGENGDGQEDDLITVRGGREYLVLNGREYRVIGHYEQENVRSGADWYISMSTPEAEEEPAEGTYLYDAAAVSGTGVTDNGAESRAGKIEAAAVSCDSGASVEAVKGMSAEGRASGGMTTNFSSMILLVLLTVLLVFLNSFPVCFYWLGTHRREIAVRKMSGAGNHRIVLWLMKEFTVLLLISFSAGLVLSVLFLKMVPLLAVPAMAESVRLMFGRGISPEGAAAGFLFLLAAGLLNMGVTMRSFRSRQIARSLGR